MKISSKLFAVILFVSSFLLFSVQPLIGKYYLPFFGGSAAVWSVALLFFMTLVLVGYLIAYIVIKQPMKMQVWFEVLFGSVAVITLAIQYLVWESPILFPSELIMRLSVQTIPQLTVLASLLISLAIPVTFLCTVSTILQHWAVIHNTHNPYLLYRFSNLGGLVAVVCYPFLLEPHLNLSMQALVWIGIFVFIVAMIIAIGIQSIKKNNVIAQARKTRLSTITRYVWLQWLALSTLVSTLLLTTAYQLTLEVAAIPFLWLAPLFIYLLSFVLAFTNKPTTFVLHLGLILVALIPIGIIVWSQIVPNQIIVQVFIYISVLFLGSMFTLSKLYQSRPHVTHLGLFYVMIGLGGVIAGILVTFVFPYIFTKTWEYIFSLSLLLLLVVWHANNQMKSLISRSILILLIVLPILALGTIVIAQRSRTEITLFEKRNFYGSIRVTESFRHLPEPERKLQHGSILHGSQVLRSELKTIPTTYYTINSGIGQVLTNLRSTNSQQRIAVVGLGVGTLASYCSDQDIYYFFELNPLVVEVAENYFTYLSDCRSRGGKTIIIEGDARINLEEWVENQPQTAFDVLVIDAFSDDAIPIHLLTQEALDLYLNTLSPSGVLVIHISNRHLDLSRVLRQYALDRQLWAYAITHNPSISPNDPPLSSDSLSNWVIISQADLEESTFADSVSLTMHHSPAVRWTDQHSNIFSVLKQW